MNTSNGRLQNIANMTFHGIFAILWLIMLSGVFIKEILQFNKNTLVLITVLITITILIWFKKIPRFIKNLKPTMIHYTDQYSIVTIVIISILIQTILQIYIGYEMAITPSSDRNIIFKQASEIALHHTFKTSNKYNFYFLRYPNNQILLLLETIWFMLLKKIRFIHFLYGNMILNILAINFSIILCIVLVNRKYGKRAAIFFQMMAFLFVPFYTYIPFVYTDTLVLPVISGLLLCYQFVEENFDKRKIKFYLCLFLMGILTWIGFELKPTVAIITMACAIHMILIKNRKKGIIATMVVILLFGTCNTIFKVTMDKIAVIDQTDYDKENFPYTHWIMMGLHKKGNYNLADRKYTSSFKTKKEKEEGNIRKIKERLENYGVFGLLLHQYIKIVSTWSNGKYDMEFHLQRQPVRKSWLQSVFFKNGKFYPLYNGYCTLYHWTLLLLIGISIIYGFIKGETGSVTMWQLALLGLFLFLSLWETKARYVMHFVPVMLLIVIDTLKKLFALNLSSLVIFVKINTLRKA